MKLSRVGAWVLLSSLFLLAWGLSLDSPLVGVVGALGLSILGVAALSIRPAPLEVRREVSSEVAEEENEVTVRLEAKTRKGLFLEIEDTLPWELELAGGSNFFLGKVREERLMLLYRLRAPVKGRYKIGPFRVRFRDALGLFFEEKEVDLFTYVSVYPRLFDLREALVRSRFPLVVSGEYVVGQPGYGSSFFALREYQTGDPYRSINWKASARSRQFIVNQAERETQARVTILVDDREDARVGTRRLNAVVLSARAARSIAHFLLRRRDRVRLVFYGEGVREVSTAGTERPIVPISEALSSTTGAGRTTLLEAVHELLPTLRPRAPLVLISSLYNDPTVSEAVRELRAYDVRVIVVSPKTEELLRISGVSESSPLYSVTAMEREVALSEVKSYGAFLVDWNPSEPLSLAFAREVGR